MSPYLLRNTSNLLVLLALVVWTTLMRLPFASNIGEDEIFYTLVAQRWLDGLPPYSASFDVKPPGLFAVFALAQAIFGASITTLKALEVICVSVSAFGLYLIGVRHLSRPVGWFAALLYPIYSLVMSGVNAPTPLVTAPFTIYAVLAFLEGGRSSRLGWMLAAGLLMGAAGTVKQTAAFVGVALLVVAICQARPHRLSAAIVFAGGAMIVPAAFLLLFALVGQVPALLAGAVFGAAGRLRGDNISFPDGLLRFMPMTRPLIVLLPLLVLTLTRGWRLRGGPMVTGVVVTLAWLGGEAGGIIATRSMYDHYFLALVPPIALLAGTAICHLVGAQPGPQPMRILAALALAMLGPFAPGQTGITASSDTVGAAAAARQLTILGVAPAAHILVVNRGLLVYLDSDRQPSSRYFHPQHLLCDFPAPDPDPLAVALSAGPDALVVANYGRRMVCERTDRWAEVVKAIGAGYCLAAHVVGTWDSFDIFLPRTSGASRCRS